MSAIAIRVRAGLAVLAVCAFAGNSRAEDSMELARKAREVLKTHCHRCHGKDGTVEGGMSYILDRDRLVARNKIVPGKTAESKLLKRMQAGKMPPPDESPRPTPDEIRLVEKWIEAGAPSADPPTVPRKRIQEADIHSRITGASVRTELVDLIQVRDDRIVTYREFFGPNISSEGWAVSSPSA